MIGFYGFVTMIVFLVILTIGLFMNDLRVRLIENNMLSKAPLTYMYMLLNYCPKYITSIQVRATKVIIYINSESLMSLLSFLSKSMFIKASNLLDIELLIIQIGRIDLRLIIYGVT